LGYKWIVFGFFKSLARLGKGEGRVVPPAKCADCGSIIMEAASSGGLDAGAGACPNPDCPPRVRGRIEHWCSSDAMDIPECDGPLVRRLVESGLVQDVADLYRLKFRELDALLAPDRERARRVLDGILASKGRELWRLVYALDVGEVNSVTARTLARAFPRLDDLFGASLPCLLALEGVGEVAAVNLHRWHGDPVNRALIERLRRAGVNFDSARA
jgi:DNA ligase (NAD+)